MKKKTKFFYHYYRKRMWVFLLFSAISTIGLLIMGIVNWTVNSSSMMKFLGDIFLVFAFSFFILAIIFGIIDFRKGHIKDVKK